MNKSELIDEVHSAAGGDVDKKDVATVVDKLIDVVERASRARRQSHDSRFRRLVPYRAQGTHGAQSAYRRAGSDRGIQGREVLGWSQLQVRREQVGATADLSAYLLSNTSLGKGGDRASGEKTHSTEDQRGKQHGSRRRGGQPPSVGRHASRRHGSRRRGGARLPQRSRPSVVVARRPRRRRRPSVVRPSGVVVRQSVRRSPRSGVVAKAAGAAKPARRRRRKAAGAAKPVKRRRRKAAAKKTAKRRPAKRRARR